MIHRRRKHRKARARNRTHKRIHSDRAIRVEPIAIDNVRHALPERDHGSHADESGREDGRNPRYRRVGAPGEPKHRDG